MEESMQIRQLKRLLKGAIGSAAVLAASCGPSSTSAGLATVRLSVGRADATAAAPVAGQDVAALGPIDLTNVDHLTVTLDSVQLSTDASQGWQTVNLTTPLPLNLTTDLGTPINIGTVTVESGACQARLFVSDVKIAFVNDVTVGPQTFTAGTEYGVTIPSGAQTGLKADGTCDATDGANVMLGFDVGATVGTIVATGAGTIMLTPVIHVEQH
jgi:hypothetical protein